MKTMPLDAFWVYLAASPLWWLTLTLGVYIAMQKVSQIGRNHPLLNPAAWAIVILIVVVRTTGTSYHDYFEGAQFLHFLLGPATVALAVPLYRQLPRLRSIWKPVAVALGLGVTTGAVSAVGIGYLMGLDHATLVSLAPKSVTTPVAMGISEILGGIPALTAALVAFTGVFGAVAGVWLLRTCGVKDDSAVGVSLGVAAHGLGTARAFEENPVSGAFSGLAMALAACLTALLLPALFGILGWL